jgi:hypothetical protein
MKTAFVATAILTASLCAMAQDDAPTSAQAGDLGTTSAPALKEAGATADGELGYTPGETAWKARPRSSAATFVMGASAAPSPQEASMPRTRERAQRDAALYKGQVDTGEFGSDLTHGSMGSQTPGK